MLHLNHRLQGYNLLSGNGIEIGAFHQPATLPEQCRVEYCDVLTKEEAITLFPEVDASRFVDVQYICDLDTQGLSIFSDNSFDFVILNHVIEHVANPINVLRELFRVTRWGGFVVISAPDKNYTFDKKRQLTPYSHLLEDYRNNITEITVEHYLDFLQGVAPDILNDPEATEKALVDVRNRREHPHVWDSDLFKEFLIKSLNLLNVKATCLFESTGKVNNFEYFAVWYKGSELSRLEYFAVWYRGSEMSRLLRRMQEIIRDKGLIHLPAEAWTYIRWRLK